ncbi:MvaI/BcnI family restriction endonuclease [Rahnella inusitata]|uniref:MvaI/BcnI restriction endonuclease domain-containing protein n=1 Tax=Rahnella inusitata TaxID=58169 RepID=A0ABX9P3A9_9GAMM|nr:MvaI/BcnI family restriction endonuclease [Rahnella inusitata]RJT13882.1 hypothetical protein D5396_07750 [Rahnella inusitata]
MSDEIVNMDKITSVMRKFGAKRIVIKKLSNNDNSKNQIYLGSDFSVIQDLPVKDILSSGISSKGAIFKAAIDFFWITPESNKEQALNAQVILYPKYPEIRLSGVLKGCSISPSHLMQPPSISEREERKNKSRYMILGICDDHVLSYMSDWDSVLSIEISNMIESQSLQLIFSIFYEDKNDIYDSRKILLDKLRGIFSLGFIPSRRLDRNGNIIPYHAMNGAGFTLESFFGIIPNGRSEPDFIDWELKAHSSGPVTLMTPEPNSGLYTDDIHNFMDNYATSKKENRVDFASIHKVGIENIKTKLSLNLEGYDLRKEEIVDPSGGLNLRNENGDLLAGWSFEKLLNHWKRKHAKTCFVSYIANKEDLKISYSYGPTVTLATGAELKKFFTSLATSVIYYDPGINVKYSDGTIKLKRRNQLRIKWKDINSIYTATEELEIK